jgi:hypothetical protein
VPSAGILTPVMVTDGGSGNGSSFQPRKDQIEASIAKVGVEVKDGLESWRASCDRDGEQKVCQQSWPSTCRRAAIRVTATTFGRLRHLSRTVTATCDRSMLSVYWMLGKV